MGHWQSKLVSSLVLYAAGFITAVYFLAPPSVRAVGQGPIEAEGFQAASIAAVPAGTDTQIWMTRIRTGIDAGIHFAEEHALRVAELIRARIIQGTAADPPAGTD